MERFNSREFYGHSLSEDPKLRTTTRNYEFKFNSSDHLDKIISRVRLDREKKKRVEQFVKGKNHIKSQNRLLKGGKSQVMKMPIVETQIARSRSQDAIVKIMSEEEIDEMIMQALQSRNDLPTLTEIKSIDDTLPVEEINTTEEVYQKDEKLPQLPVEIFPNQQPQWVEIKPAHKSMASLFEVPADAAEDSSDSVYLSALNLGDVLPSEKENEELVNKINYFDSISLSNLANDDFVPRKQEDDDEESLPDSPISLDIESSLNEYEHLEMERVFEKFRPNIPNIEFESLESQQESEYIEYSDKEDEIEYTKSQDDNVNFEKEEFDSFNSREFYRQSLSEDPKLRTTTRNYEFKYNSPDHLEKIISRVRLDREKKKRVEQFVEGNNLIMFRNRVLKVEKSQVMEMPEVETQIGRSRSQEAIVKIMSEKEIDEMISQAEQSANNFPALAEKKYVDEALPLEEINTTEEINKKDEILPQLLVEIFPKPQPQWVEIKPVQKSIASLFEVPADSAEDSLDSDDPSALNLDDEIPERENEELVNKINYFDLISLENMANDDFVTLKQESDFQKDDDKEPIPESPILLDIESSLNEYEHMEMERVFQKFRPNIPRIDFESLESQQESESGEYSDKEDENENTKTQDDDVSVEKVKFYNQPEIHERKTVPVPPSIKALSSRSAQSSPPKTSRSVKKTRKSHKAAPNPSTNRKSPIASIDLKSIVKIEDLKQEKLRIFSKMTSIQEKIIKSLDVLRINLVEISLPDGEREKKLRERNALEFSVRFSRNYLFPLGKMIEDLRISPKEDYRSALTNEPCVKVCGIYGLLSKTVECYQKQLRHFFTDSFPNKLDSLLNLIKDTTNICLEKQIFDKRDTVIQCLLSRCEMFLEFVMEFAEIRKTARNKEMIMQSERRSSFKLAKTSSKWDLTMNLNNLNMYEPKLVQKTTKKTPQRKTGKKDSQKTDTSIAKKKKLIPRDSADFIGLAIDDPVETQVLRDNNVDSVQVLNDEIVEEHDSELAKNVIETLQGITKDEVNQIFGPIVNNLDSILKTSCHKTLIRERNITLGEQYRNIMPNTFF